MRRRNAGNLDHPDFTLWRIMSLAESFNALGMGNGFPFCPATIDVVEFEAENNDEGIGLVTHWITLGGYRKADFDASIPVTDEQIELSKQNAMKLFWNLEKMVGEISYSPAPAEVNELVFTEAPKDRVCNTTVSKIDYYSGTRYAMGMVASVKIVRMVAGATFLGYGISAYPRSYSPYAQRNQWGFHALVESPYSSDIQVGMFSFVTEDSGIVVADIVKSGIHFIGYAPSSGNASIPSDSDYSLEIIARIDDLEFFTYPT